MLKKYFALLILFAFIACNKAPESKQQTNNEIADPLPSWNDGELKKAIIDYVTKVTKEGSVDFIPVDDRIATFDNDGTLWPERPYVQELFAFYRVKRMVEKNPSLAKRQPFKAVIEKDKAYFEKGRMKAVIELINATHTNLSEIDYEQEVSDFYSTATFPPWNVPVKKIAYQPQLELLEYLKANHFKIFICTGGTVEFVRGIAPEIYGIPKEQVIGTSFKYELREDSVRVYIFRKPELSSFNDKESKPVNIQLHIGKIPVFACGNEGGAGDIAMLRFSQSSTYPSFQLLVNHDDSLKEFYYQEKDNLSLRTASVYKWHVVSIKNDWKTVRKD